MPKSTSPRCVYLHVGVPKSGTTFLQASLAQNAKALRKAGVLVPGDQETLFQAALDVRGTHKAWGRRRKDVEGSWDRLCREALKHAGPTVLSQELLAAASVDQIAAAVAELRGCELHVIVSARDPARQATAEWQEGIKHGRRLTFDEFRRKVLADDSEGDHARRFRAAQDLPAVLARWGSVVPTGHVHVVCAPSSLSAGPDVLWRRFAEVVGLDPDRLPPAGLERSNASLGSSEVDLLRRVNIALDKRLVQPEYGQVVKRLYAQRLLAAHPSPRPAAPAEMQDDFRLVGERWVKEIEAAGYTTHGDLAELVPSPPAASSRHPDDVDPARQVEVAAASTAELLLELQRRGTENARLEEENARLRKRRRQLRRKLRDVSGRAVSAPGARPFRLRPPAPTGGPEHAPRRACSRSCSGR